MTHWEIFNDPGEFVKLYLLVMAVNIFAFFESWCHMSKRASDLEKPDLTYEG